jgi:hypothetical protein
LGSKTNTDFGISAEKNSVFAGAESLEVAAAPTGKRFEVEEEGSNQIRAIGWLL